MTLADAGRDVMVENVNGERGRIVRTQPAPHGDRMTGREILVLTETSGRYEYWLLDLCSVVPWGGVEDM